MEELSELETLLVLEMKKQGVSPQTILMIMEIFLDEESQEEFGRFLLSIKDIEIPEWKLIIAANIISEKLSIA